jgi:hypothetical protein
VDEPDKSSSSSILKKNRQMPNKCSGAKEDSATTTRWTSPMTKLTATETDGTPERQLNAASTPNEASGELFVVMNLHP